MKFGLSIFTMILFVFISGFESGKKIHYPYESAFNLPATDGIMISKKYANPGFIIDTGKYYTHLPIFSYMEENGKKIIGTGTKPIIYDILTGDTVTEFQDGETVYKMVYDKKLGIIAAIMPSGAIISIKDNKSDTIAVFENSGINVLKKINKEIYIAANNVLYKLKGNELKKIIEVNDNNISYLYKNGNDLYIGTEGKGKIIKITGKKQKVLFSSKSGEVNFITKKNGNIIALYNTVLQNNGKNSNYRSSLLKIYDNTADTIYADEDFILLAEEYLDGVLLTRGETPEILYYDGEKIFTCGFLKTDYILSLNVYGKNAYISTGDPGRIYAVKGFNNEQTYFSNVIDFGKEVIINSIHASVDGKGRLYVKQGNSFDIDSSWTSFILIKPGMYMNMPEYRFIQYRYDFSDKNDRLNSIDFYYKTRNHKPEIDSINIFEPRIIPDYISDESLNMYTPLNMSMYPEYNTPIFKTDRKVIFVSWFAKDRDSDKLDYNVYLKDKYGLYPVKKHLLENYALIYCDGFDNGYYDLIIEANDSLSNPNKFMKTQKQEQIFIDNIEPIISDISFARNTLKFSVEDAHSFIDEMYYSVNGSSLKTVFPDDGIYDSKRESFSVNIEKKQGEDLFIVIYVLDKFGNIGRAKKSVK